MKPVTACITRNTIDVSFLMTLWAGSLAETFADWSLLKIVLVEDDVGFVHILSVLALAAMLTVFFRLGKRNSFAARAQHKIPL